MAPGNEELELCGRFLRRPRDVENGDEESDVSPSGRVMAWPYLGVKTYFRVSPCPVLLAG